MGRLPHNGPPFSKLLEDGYKVNSTRMHVKKKKDRAILNYNELKKIDKFQKTSPSRLNREIV